MSAVEDAEFSPACETIICFYESLLKYVWNPNSQKVVVAIVSKIFDLLLMQFH